MLSVLFTATRTAWETDEDCSVVALGNDEQYLELQRNPTGLHLEMGRFEAESKAQSDPIECLRFDSKRLEVRFRPEASAQLGTEQLVHIPLRLTPDEVHLLRANLREITADLIAFDEALVAEKQVGK